MPGSLSDPVRLSPVQNIVEVGWSHVIAVRLFWEQSIEFRLGDRFEGSCGDWPEGETAGDAWLISSTMTWDGAIGNSWKWSGTAWVPMSITSNPTDGDPYVDSASDVPNGTWTPPTDTTMGLQNPDQEPNPNRIIWPWPQIQSPDEFGVSPKPNIPDIQGSSFDSTTTVVVQHETRALSPPIGHFRLSPGGLCIEVGTLGAPPIENTTYTNTIALDFLTTRISVTTPATSSQPGQPAQSEFTHQYKPIAVAASPQPDANDPDEGIFNSESISVTLMCQKVSGVAAL